MIGKRKKEGEKEVAKEIGITNALETMSITDVQAKGNQLQEGIVPKGVEGFVTVTGNIVESAKKCRGRKKKVIANLLKQSGKIITTHLKQGPTKKSCCGTGPASPSRGMVRPD